MSYESVLEHFNQALAAARSSDDVFEALHQLADERAGAKLFTIMRVDMDAMLASRAYSSDTRNYPTSGTKPVEMNHWFDIVHGRQECFVANTLAEIAKVFPDHELIGSLGCGSVMNLPVILGNELVATVNLLNEEQYFKKERVIKVKQELLLPSTAAILFER